MTVTVGTLPELVPDCLASIRAGVATALASAADAAAIANEPFIMIVIILLLAAKVVGVQHVKNPRTKKYPREELVVVCSKNELCE